MLRFFILLALGQVAAAAKMRIHVIPHTHDDVGWRKTVDQYYAGLNSTIQLANVNNIINSVISSLMMDSRRVFHYVEQAFFQRWWRQQTNAMHDIVRNLVKNKQLIFMNGGWCMHDEAGTHFIDMVDQTTLGHRFIVQQFGPAAVPTIGWQIDPFGHSSTQAAYLSAAVGFDALFFARIDWQDYALRFDKKKLEMIWDASQSLGSQSSVYTGVFPFYGYGPPPVADYFNCNIFALNIQPDKRLHDYNLDYVVEAFLGEMEQHAAGIAGPDVMLLAGSDFQWENAANHFWQLERLMEGVNASGKAEMFYSTPAEYIKIKQQQAQQQALPRKTDDFFPYADSENGYWTGYFVSRPTLKRYVRYASGVFSAYRKLIAGATTTPEAPAALESLAEALAVAQHHDAVAGTAKQHVAFDYAQRIAGGMITADAAAAAAVSSAGFDVVAPCHLANESRCEATEVDGSVSFVVLSTFTAPHSFGTVAVPVKHSDYSATADDAGVVLQLVPSPPCVSNYKPNDSGCAPYVAVVTLSNMPPIGLVKVTLKRRQVERTAEAATAPTKVRRVAVDSDDAATDTTHSSMAEVQTISFRNNQVRATFNSEGELFVAGEGMTSKTRLVWGAYTSYWVTDFYNKPLQPSGAYVFRPVMHGNETHCGEVFCGLEVSSLSPVVDSTTSNTVGVDVRLRDATLKEEYVHMRLMLIEGAAFVDVTYTVGPIPMVPAGMPGNNRGLEVVLKFETNIDNQGTWYTDSNGREFVKRQYNYRPTWPLEVYQPIAGNYYPMNAGAWLAGDARDARGEVQQQALYVATDASIGCGSTKNGSLEMMVHRRVLHDDWKGVTEPLNETEGVTWYDPHGDVSGGMHFGPALIVRGKMRLYPILSPDDAKMAAWMERALGYAAPVVFPMRSSSDADTSSAASARGAGSPRAVSASFGSSIPLPLTLLTWENVMRGERTVDLVRIAHQQSVEEGGEKVRAVIGDVLGSFDFAYEQTLAASYPISRMRERMEFNAEGHTVAGVNYKDTDEYKDKRTSGSDVINFHPLEVRTFLVYRKPRM